MADSPADGGKGVRLQDFLPCFFRFPVRQRGKIEGDILFNGTGFGTGSPEGNVRRAQVSPGSRLIPQRGLQRNGKDGYIFYTFNNEFSLPFFILFHQQLKKVFAFSLLPFPRFSVSPFASLLLCHPLLRFVFSFSSILVPRSLLPYFHAFIGFPGRGLILLPLCRDRFPDSFRQSLDPDESRHLGKGAQNRRVDDGFCPGPEFVLRAMPPASTVATLKSPEKDRRKGS